MTRENAKDYLPLVQALAEGKNIQVRTPLTWVDADYSLIFTDPPSYYRIKPEPKLRPWKPDEVPVGAVVRWKSNPQKRGLLTGCDEDYVYVAFNYALHRAELAGALVSYEHSTDNGATWLPCGVMEDAA